MKRNVWIWQNKLWQTCHVTQRSDFIYIFWHILMKLYIILQKFKNKKIKVCDSDFNLYMLYIYIYFKYVQNLLGLFYYLSSFQEIILGIYMSTSNFIYI